MILVKHGYVVTMNKERAIFQDGAVVLQGDRIVKVGKTAELEQERDYERVIDAKGKLIMPGLINGHTHIFQTLFRGLGDDRPLSEWLGECVYPLSAHVGYEESYAAMKLSAVEMIQTGTTTFVDSHFIHHDKKAIDGIANAALEAGMRAVLGRTAIDQGPAPTRFHETVEEAVKEAVRIIELYHDHPSGRLKVRVEPLNETVASPEMIKAMYEVSSHYQVGMNMHLAETVQRVKSVQDRYQLRSVEYLHDLGVLGPHLLLAHCVWINQKEIHLLAETKTNVAHNAVSNQYLADGVAPVPAMLDNQINVTIGPDGAASNNNLDMFEVMKSAALLHKVNTLNTTALTADKVLEMATIDAAKAIGLEEEIGSLEAGKKADLIMVSLAEPEMIPSFSPLSHLVYSAKGNVVTDVIIDGNIVYENRSFTSLDKEKIIGKGNEVIRSLLDRGNAWELTKKPDWPVY
ncbi:amidohydrolase [Alkalihalobacillus oceani]|uniref:amidohydrolase family protein n=1 Tax=Halalkalibacter oceani TaxID=1653776 RepID=UPI00203F071B|nr:amidohydrolase [Halalkalibacter oceani]MCM3760941.1 amidohydrolase [Halalkalibacter oceani]